MLGRRIASATAQLALSGGLVRMLSLITMPILTHLLAPSAYGTAAMVGTLISLVSVLALAGMDVSYVRAYHSNVPPSGQAVELFSWRYALGAGLLSGAILFAVWPLIANAFSLPGYLGGLLGVGILLSLVHTLTLARARLNNRYRAMSSALMVAGLGAAAISLGVAYWWRQDELPLILAMVVRYLILILILGSPPVTQLCKSSTLDSTERHDIFKIGLAGVVTAPTYWLLSSSDRWFLGYFEDAASVGIYSIGYSVAIIGLVANNAVMSVWTPETSREYEENPDHAHHQLGKVAEVLVAGLACVLLAVMAAGGDIIRLLAAPTFHSAASLVPFIAIGVFAYGIMHLANASLLLKKRFSASVPWWIAGSVFSALLNVGLIPWLGGLGAALTQALSFAFIAGGIVYSAQKLFPLQLNWRRLRWAVTGVLVAGIAMFPAWASSPAISLLLKLPVGMLVAAAILKFVSPEILPHLKWKNLCQKSVL